METPERVGPRPGPITLSDLEEAASRCLDPRLWAYVAGGAGEERTVRANRAAFEAATLVPRAFGGAGEFDPRTRLLGADVDVPFFVAPTAYQGQIHPDGELGVARAAAAAGALAVFSTLSTASLEEIARASGAGRRWFQLYHQPDAAVGRRLVERAERAGFAAIVLTADTPLLGVRDRQARGGFAIDARQPVGNGPDIVPPARGLTEGAGRYRIEPPTAPTWESVDTLREWTRLPIVVKGILDRRDAEACVDHGAAGLVVSNHGGRQLDGAPATLEVLPEIAAAVGRRVEVYLDGGVRRGSDVLVALARGARAVGLGRPILWALSVGGERAVAEYLGLLRAELLAAMVLTGTPTVDGREGSPRASPRDGPARLEQ
ncbi:MAG TPA: alpha-hydroxy acid oxidase [Thermoplasmata archaeon]|nr:alpha-hydroxy acid oxidase [Thermoplasmata archaeon]